MNWSIQKFILITSLCISCFFSQPANASGPEPYAAFLSEVELDEFHAGEAVRQENATQDDDDLKENVNSVGTSTRWFLVITLILSLMLVALAYSRLLTQRKANRVLAHQRNILKKALQDLRINEEKYKGLFSQANDAIFLMDQETFIDCNDKTLQMFACQRDEIIGQPPYNYSPDKQPDGKDSKGKSLYLIDQCYQGIPQRFYWVHSKKDGTLFDAEVSLNKIKLEGKSLIQAIVRDISERVRAEREMVLAIEKAEKATESKTFFLAKMSHEIRTMLGGIMSAAQLLTNTKVNKNQSELLDIIGNSADNLLAIVNEILDFSKIEAGKIEIENSPFALRKILEETVNAYLPKAKEKGIKLFLSIHHNIPEFVSGDELRLKQILANLLSNAIKFTPKGSVTLDAMISSEEESNHEIAFKVLDTGIGIPENKIKDMFSEYSQSDVSISRRFGGTGLGLNIVYNLVNLMEGSIEVESVLDKGTSFSVVITFSKTDHVAEDEPEKEPILYTDGEKYKVLLAEDNVINQKITMINLNHMGHDIDLAENGVQAWQMYQENDYNIILMDIQMPEMDGIEVTRLIRKYEADHPDKARTRIVALTANILGQDVEYCLSEGMDAYISKPFRIEDILEKLEPEEPTELF